MVSDCASAVSGLGRHFSVGLGSTGRVGLKNGYFRFGFCLRMCGEWFFCVGLGSCGRGIEKTTTSGLVSVCACAARDFFSVGLGSCVRRIEKRSLPVISPVTFERLRVISVWGTGFYSV